MSASDDLERMSTNVYYEKEIDASFVLTYNDASPLIGIGGSTAADYAANANSRSAFLVF